MEESLIIHRFRCKHENTSVGVKIRCYKLQHRNKQLCVETQKFTILNAVQF